MVTFREAVLLEPKHISTVPFSDNKACIYLHGNAQEVLLALNRSLFPQTCKASNVRRMCMYKNVSMMIRDDYCLFFVSSGVDNSNFQPYKRHSPPCGSFYNSALKNLGCSAFIVALRHGHVGGGDAVSRGQHPASRSYWPVLCRHQPTPQLQL